MDMIRILFKYDYYLLDIRHCIFEQCYELFYLLRPINGDIFQDIRQRHTTFWGIFLSLSEMELRHTI